MKPSDLRYLSAGPREVIDEHRRTSRTGEVEVRFARPSGGVAIVVVSPNQAVEMAQGLLAAALNTGALG